MDTKGRASPSPRLRALVTGAGGFIGAHLVPRLSDNYEVVAVDRKPLADWFFRDSGAVNVVSDVADPVFWQHLPRQDLCFHLAADMGGMPFIDTHAYDSLSDVVSTKAVIDSAIDGKLRRVIFASSACIYPVHLQSAAEFTPLREDLAEPAQPDSGYGWSKLYAEKLLDYAYSERSLASASARLFNIYGPLCAIDYERAKAPAAICRAVLLAKGQRQRTVELLGSGKEVRSFLHVSDCVSGLIALAANDAVGPMNFGSTDLLAIEHLASRIAEIAGYTGSFRFNGRHPGVAARVPSIEYARERLAWTPSVPLEEGLADLVAFVEDSLSTRQAAQHEHARAD